MKKDVLERFLRYVKVDTQSKEGVEDRYPSTEKQLDLSRMLVAELESLGLEDVALDEHGYVTATLPEHLPEGSARAADVPTVGLLAHVDTYHEVSGADVKPIVHERYAGGPIVLGKANTPIDPADSPELADYTGDDIVTSDGSTLLGADDKAGVAEIVTLMALYRSNPALPHPRIRVGFTPDEEVGEGTRYFDVKKFAADVAYTLDGSGMGEVEDETFCADTAVVSLKGIDVHPGYAKGKMVNAVRWAAELIHRIPADATPETTDGRQDYLHAYQVSGSVTEAKITCLVRSFSEAGLEKMEAELERIRAELVAAEPRLGIEIEIKESYRNMKQVLDEHPKVIAYAEEAMRKAGIEPVRKAIRGGTDGARLSFLGLPTPNLSAGGYNFHSTHEWVPVGAMVKAVEMLVELMRVYAERGLKRV
ncbi:MAG: peptidase T [Deltaproteobacteria bacterium]|nr:peptidase T [Deltaproteobacteria bacterium]